VTDLVNAEQRAEWNADDGEHWVEFQTDYDAMLRPFGDAVLAQAALGPGEAVLDVGCGCGDTTLAAARAVGAEGRTIGVDISEPMVGLATRRGHDDGSAAAFVVGDAQLHDFGPAAFDAIISRFGVMFFDDSRAAFANLARTLRPGGRLVFACWRELFANDWLLVPGAALAEHVALPPVEPGAPGAFAFADDAEVRSILTDAGFDRVTIEPFDASLLMPGGPSVAGTVAFLRLTGFARPLLAAADPATIEAATAAAARALEPHRQADGVRLGGAAWLVSALAPAR
jgi:SAM-dependent methyltransferase